MWELKSTQVTESDCHSEKTHHKKSSEHAIGNEQIMWPGALWLM